MGCPPPVRTPEPGSSPKIAPYDTIWSKRPKLYSNILIHVCLFVLTVEFAERLSYYGINQGLKNFLHDKLGIETASASSLKNTWTSVCYLSPLIGAWIADEKWGRYKTILVFGVWYCIGNFLVAMGSHPNLVKNHSSLSKGIFLFGLFGGIGVATGAIKSNVVTFGADQFDPYQQEQKDQRALFFSLFYWCINIGACFSYGYLTILCVNGFGKIPQDYGYFAAYMICAFAMLLAVITFFAGSSRYVKMPPEESALSKLLSVIWKNTRYSYQAKFIVGGFLIFLVGFSLNFISSLILLAFPTFNSQPFSVVAGICAIFGVASWMFFGMDPTYMDASKISNGGPLEDSTVDEIKLVIRVLPWGASDVIWNCVYDQIDSGFQSITQQCDLRLGSAMDSVQIPGATLGIVAPVTIVVMIPLLDYVVYPVYEKYFKKRPSSYGKGSAGLVIASIAMIWTGVFEIIRRNSGPLEGNSCYPSTSKHCQYILANGGKVPMNKMYWVASIFQYILVGTAECLINVTAFEVYYSNVPDYLKSTCQSIGLFMTSMGANVASIFALLFKSSIPDNLNEGNAEYMFFAVAALNIVNTIAFMMCMVKMQFGVHSAPSIQLEEDDKDLCAMAKRVSSLSSVDSARVSYNLTRL